MDPVKLSTETVLPMPVTVIGTGDGRVKPLDGVVATTPGAHTPNLLVNIVTPMMAIVVRFINAYLTTLVGLVAAGMTSNIIPATDFGHLVIECAKLSLAGAGLGLMKDCLTIFSGLERKFPLGTGSV